MDLKIEKLKNFFSNFNFFLECNFFKNSYFSIFSLEFFKNFETEKKF